MPEAIADAELDEMEARANAASVGPWVRVEGESAKERDIWGNPIHIRGPHAPVLSGWAFSLSDADEEFIIHAREDVPKLLTEVRRLRTLLKRKES